MLDSEEGVKTDLKNRCIRIRLTNKKNHTHRDTVSFQKFYRISFVSCIPVLLRLKQGRTSDEFDKKHNELSCEDNLQTLGCFLYRDFVL